MKQGVLTNKKTKRDVKYWIHKFPFKLLKRLDSKKCLGAYSKRGRIIKKLLPNDEIILFTTFNNNIEFIAYTRVDEIIIDKAQLYGCFESPIKISLKGIKYFTQPLLAREIGRELDFLKNKKKIFKYFQSEFREISEKDFKKILSKSTLTKKYPPYFEEVSFNVEDFIVNTIKSLVHVLKKTESRRQYEIKSFLSLLKKTLDVYGVEKTLDEVNEFYAKNAYRLGFKHIPSRVPDEVFYLYDSSGKKGNYSFISLD